MSRNRNNRKGNIMSKVDNSNSESDRRVVDLTVQQLEDNAPIADEEVERELEPQLESEVAVSNTVITKADEPQLAVIEPPQISTDCTDSKLSLEDDITAYCKKNNAVWFSAFMDIFNSYSVALKPRTAVNPSKGGDYQYSLFTGIINLIENTDVKDFKTVWNYVLKLVSKHRGGNGQLGVFEDRFIFRFSDQWPKTNEEHMLFNNILNIMVNTCEPNQRKNVASKFTFNTSLKDAPGSVKDKLLMFYM